MTHDRIGRQLSAYLDRELTPEEARAVERHLDGCPACREELEALRQTRALLRALPERPLPEDFWPELRRTLQREAAPRTRGLPAVRAWLDAIRARPAPALAVVAVVLLLAVTLVRGQLDRLRAAEFGLDLLVREHAITVAADDPLADPAYLGFVVTQANLALVGATEEARR
ncbi:MAG: zf-HC2 domain-containing protein [Armatimonadota bacterium]|nr:zf-HC2 domain-containing protein [Armatimonadota bacterium]MDR7447833.1 zf-HC2 domain-containing protein [Armatimonadota bacterium]MDR7459850.1 zf-HC2 domain-containing protein [Armatimonadota bacterium]MDR7479818.1 zf-HC2 domain-containing protein [Armatimonadota bacterium]MDR7487519.1 zf-HC2 domain-containing protein [Armatimonadota bacterium]